MFLNEIRTVMNEENQVRETEAMAKLHLMFQQRLARDGNHRLGQIAQPLAQSRARAAGKNDRLPAHRPVTSRTISSTERSTASSEVRRGFQPSVFSFSIE